MFEIVYWDVSQLCEEVDEMLIVLCGYVRGVLFKWLYVWSTTQKMFNWSLELSHLNKRPINTEHIWILFSNKNKKWFHSTGVTKIFSFLSPNKEKIEKILKPSKVGNAQLLLSYWRGGRSRQNLSLLESQHWS